MARAPRGWTPPQSREVMQLSIARLRPADKLYERIFEMMKRRQAKLERETHATLAIPRARASAVRRR